MKSSLANNPYLLDILKQPDALEATLDGFQSLDPDAFHRLAQKLSSGALKRVVLTGMGASFHALHPLRLSLIAQGIQTNLLETSELVHYAIRLLSPETLVVAVSQSGRSIEILQLLEQLPEKTPLIAITNTADSPMALKLEACLLTRAGAEHSVSCKTYVTTLAALALLGDLLADRDPAGTLAACRKASGQMRRYLSGWEQLVEQGIQEMDGVRSLIVVGRGPSLAAVGTGSLIVKEAAHVHAEGMSSAAFRHGPIELISSQDMQVLAYAGAGSGRPLNANLIADIRRAGGRAQLIEKGKAGSIFHLPDTLSTALPIIEILPLQLLSIALAVRNNHVPGQFAHGSKVTQIP